MYTQNALGGKCFFAGLEKGAYGASKQRSQHPNRVAMTWPVAGTLHEHGLERLLEA